MGGAIIRGYAAAAPDGAASVIVCEKDPEKLAALEKDPGVTPAEDLRCLAAASDVILLAVKPSNIEEALSELAPALRSDGCGHKHRLY